MKKITLIVITILTILLFTTCDDILNPEPNGRWNPLDPDYNADTDPGAALDTSDPDPKVIINGTVNDTTPRQTKSWSWGAVKPDCTFRFMITQNAVFTFSDEAYSAENTASQDDGDGVYYLFVQAKDADGLISPVATASAVLDNTAPAAPTDFSTASFYQKINLSWVNPVSDFDHVEVRGSTVTNPVSINDGTEIYSGSTEGCSDTELVYGTTYYYSIFTLDEAGNISVRATRNDTPDSLRIYAYIADSDHGLVIVEVTNPASPAYVGAWDTAGFSYDVHVDNDYAYVADDNSGLMIIDISNAPTFGTPVYVTGRTRGVFVKDNYAYAAKESSGLQVIDVSNPEVPVDAGLFDTAGNAVNVAVDGSCAYVTDGSAGLKVIDVSDPFLPSKIGELDTFGYATDLYVFEDYAYIADGSMGLQIIDVSDPAEPAHQGNIDTDNAQAVFVDGNYAYIADGVAGLQIIDISNPSEPVISNTFNTAGEAKSVYIYENYAYVGDGAEGLLIIEITDPESSGLSGTYYNTPGFARGVYVKIND